MPLLCSPDSQISTPDLGGKRGRLSDWITQRWVQYTGRPVTWKDYPWLEAPVGDVDTIGTDFFRRFAERNSLQIIEDGSPRGLLEDFASLEGTSCRVSDLDAAVIDFYEKTSEYEFDVWSEWAGLFKPFGVVLALLFSRRLQQLNVPLSPLDTKLGITSEVLKIRTSENQHLYSAWIRENIATGKTLYAGGYSVCQVPGFKGGCIKVAFPLPNGYALVIMKPESHVDGTFTVRSEGKQFGDPGFYFYVESEPGRGWARYVATLKESITVFPDERRVLRADHELRLCGLTFLRLHYRMFPTRTGR